jgi:hypothetical protein
MQLYDHETERSSTTIRQPQRPHPAQLRTAAEVKRSQSSDEYAAIRMFDLSTRRRDDESIDDLHEAFHAEPTLRRSRQTPAARESTAGCQVREETPKRVRMLIIT